VEALIVASNEVKSSTKFAKLLEVCHFNYLIVFLQNGIKDEMKVIHVPFRSSLHWVITSMEVPIVELLLGSN
jgi:hypothetical protein